MARGYALIVGQGRSGTNWLLEMIDLSPETFCRNEPYGCAGSEMSELIDLRDAELEPSTFGPAWDRAVAASLARIGERDHRALVHKRYLWWASWRFGLYRFAHSPRLRRTARVLVPPLGPTEFEFPPWLGPRALQARAFGVLKLNRVPSFAGFVLQHRPDVPVLHIVRHPGGFLHSWRSRYLALNDQKRVLAENALRIENVARANARWASRFTESDVREVNASELAYWRYANESIHECGRGKPNYQFISFEDLSRDPLPIMRRVYEACRLPLTEEIVARIQATAGGSNEIAGKWRSQLPAAQIALVERVLRQTTLPIPA